MKKIKVIVIDDSALVRKILFDKLNDIDISVVAAEPDPYEGRDKIVELNPDIIILDIEMPRMDGITFLKKLMKYKPIPVIILSSLTKKNSDISIEAIDSGAIDVVSKPGGPYSVGSLIYDLKEKIRYIGKSKEYIMDKKLRSMKSKKIKHINNTMAISRTTNKIIAIGASTGGTEAIFKLLSELPRNMPPIVIVQHMPAAFLESFAQRLNSICKLYVKTADDKEILSKGKVLISPGNIHMKINRSGARYYVKLSNDKPVFHQKPSVEVMFNSVAEYVGKNAIGVILTGMGRDGAKGLLNMKKSGAYTIAQDEKSSIVFGMPREAIECGGVDKIVSLDNMSRELVNLSQ